MSEARRGSIYENRPKLSDEARKALSPYSDRIASLLHYRGVTDVSLADRFLVPDYERDTHDPFLLKDADKAVDRILKAIADKEKIVVYGDYDADGIPATVLMHDFFAKVGHTNIEFYIPHRHTEGFGLNMGAIDKIRDMDAKLIITVDCGVADIEEVARAQSYGIDVIITDHHQVPEIEPAAFAIINPKRVGCEYPEKMLCGSGVAFKLVQAILKRNRFDIKDGWEKWLLDMVGIATLSDMVPLVGENRIFATYGLIVARRTPRVGLVRLLKAVGVDQSLLTEDDVGFSVSPRINAASRMGDPRDAFELLVSTDEADAGTRARALERLNDERKSVVARMTKEAKKMLEEKYRDQIPPVIAMGNPSWMPSLLGLVCTALSREYGRPSFLWGREGGEELKGSCRSDGTCDVVALMRAVPADVIAQCGGHAQAGGFVVDEKGVHGFEEAFLAAHASLATVAVPVAPEWIDDTLSPSQIDYRLGTEIATLAPFGVGNPRPLLKVIGRIASVKGFGSDKQHLEIELADLSNQSRSVSCFAFYVSPASFGPVCAVGQEVEIIGHLDVSTFRGRKRIRIRIIDVLGRSTEPAGIAC